MADPKRVVLDENENQIPEEMSGFLGYGTSDPSPPEYEMDRNQLNWLQQSVMNFYENENIDPGVRSALAALDDWMPGIPFHDIVPDPPTSLPGGALVGDEYVPADASRAGIGKVMAVADAGALAVGGYKGYKYVKGAVTDAGSASNAFKVALKGVKNWKSSGLYNKFQAFRQTGGRNNLMINHPHSIGLQAFPNFQQVNLSVGTNSYDATSGVISKLANDLYSAGKYDEAKSVSRLRAVGTIDDNYIFSSISHPGTLKVVKYKPGSGFNGGDYAFENFDVNLLSDSERSLFNTAVRDALTDPNAATKLDKAQGIFENLSSEGLSTLDFNQLDSLPPGDKLRGYYGKKIEFEHADGSIIKGEIISETSDGAMMSVRESNGNIRQITNNTEIALDADKNPIMKTTKSPVYVEVSKGWTHGEYGVQVAVRPETKSKLANIAGESYEIDRYDTSPGRIVPDPHPVTGDRIPTALTPMEANQGASMSYTITLEPNGTMVLTDFAAFVDDLPHRSDALTKGTQLILSDGRYFDIPEDGYLLKRAAYQEKGKFIEEVTVYGPQGETVFNDTVDITKKLL